MRRVIRCVLIACLGLLPIGNGDAFSLVELERQVAQAETQHAKTTRAKSVPRKAQQTSTPTARQIAIKKALNQGRVAKNMTWTAFQANNQSLVAKIDARNTSPWGPLSDQELTWLQDIVAKMPVNFEYARPDYGALTKNIPVIYLTDASGHSERAIINEVKQVLQAVRKANPQARIVLAMEFAEMLYNATPIRFAGEPKEFMRITSPYDYLVPVADKLNIDILGLDDLFFVQNQHSPQLKIGNKMLVLNEKPGMHPDFIKDLNHLSSTDWNNLIGYVGMSAYGVKLRNEQWARYIKAVKPYYDIIIVYAGQGHVDSEAASWQDLPQMVGGNYAVFNFYSLEQNSREKAWASDVWQLVCDANSCSMSQTEDISSEEQLVLEKGPEWDGTKFLYIKGNTALDVKKHVSSFPAFQKWQANRMINPLKESSGMGAQAYFDVYLPLRIQH